MYVCTYNVYVNGCSQSGGTKLFRFLPMVDL